MNTEGMKPIRLLIVDDHPVVRAGLRVVQELSTDIRVVAEAGDAAAALTAVSEHHPDVVLLDIRLRGENGIDVCRSIKTKAPECRVLFLTSYVDDQLIMSALEAGADGYLLKESDTGRLVEAILEVQSGEPVFDAEVSRRMTPWPGGTATGPGSAAARLKSLTPQEHRLLAEVAKGKTDKEAAAQLGLTPKTARNYLDRIFGKLGVHTRTEAATVYVRAGRGRWTDEPRGD